MIENTKPKKLQSKVMKEENEIPLKQEEKVVISDEPIQDIS